MPFLHYLRAFAGAAALLAASHALAQESLPTRLGDCAETTIADIGPRLMDDPDFESGVGIAYANGLGQVSYDRVQEVIDSQPGDPVRMCLVYIPANCPPGDDRGKVYATTNLRTGATWEMPDAQHECGGA
ncbi:hypothetical protein Rumeso_04839 [Rubellimicrobium mesophilum DSM 19309]|uniref:Uncharacterized protein n=1 Tax=Rubellimicrobium mesophilum DSM 19309 TaxID=442562 RepID=A0A017HDC7_9RHOB|nr:hypothetical protein [Rubellimicrobium mesophilum]EYD72133.1 hypothetical protein Rumeso_04839 [Rubellimicrobium mesophilum DSM 19309]